jgi:hypothetical protein
MNENVSNCLVGPLRGTRGWWQELGKLSDSAHPKRPRKGRAPKGAPPAPEEAPTAPERPLRKELVERVRREIAAGTYDISEKWEAALDRLLDKLTHE